jgi:hypothetical protein
MAVWLPLVRWLSRLVLFAAMSIMTLVSLRYLTDPAGASAGSGMSLSSSLGFTNARSGIGGIFLACAIFVSACLMAERRLLIGLSFVALAMGIILAIRIPSAIADDTFRESVSLIAAEALFTVLAAVGVGAEIAARRPLRAR